MMKHDIQHTVDILLNNNLSYEVLIMDPKAQIFSSSPSIIPRSKIKLLHDDKPKTTEVFLKVKFNDTRKKGGLSAAFP